MKFPENREDFDDCFIVCEDVSGFDLAFRDCDFNETMEIMLKLNNSRNIEFRMELCFDNPYMPQDRCVPLFCIGVAVIDGMINGYADIHYSDTVQEQYPLDLTGISKKMYGNYEFYSDTELAKSGMEVIRKHFNMRLVPATQF